MVQASFIQRKVESVAQTFESLKPCSKLSLAIQRPVVFNPRLRLFAKPLQPKSAQLSLKAVVTETQITSLCYFVNLTSVVKEACLLEQ